MFPLLLFFSSKPRLWSSLPMYLHLLRDCFNTSLNLLYWLPDDLLPCTNSPNNIVFRDLSSGVRIRRLKLCMDDPCFSTTHVCTLQNFSVRDFIFPSSVYNVPQTGQVKVLQHFHVLDVSQAYNRAEIITSRDAQSFVSVVMPHFSHRLL